MSPCMLVDCDHVESLADGYFPEPFQIFEGKGLA